MFWLSKIDHVIWPTNDRRGENGNKARYYSRLQILPLFIAALRFVTASLRSAEPKASLPAAKVVPGAIVLDYRDSAAETLSGFFIGADTP